ncbi:hypothetical protein STRZYGA_00300 [Brevundimonas phage vB_BpoS-Strzyga]|nr:hypothetical protein STRZYGA_00300 [Brevundimonas phage vB_BpoS-Strzyga]
MTTTTFSIEQIEQMTAIVAAFDAARAPVASIEYDDDAEIINVYTTDGRHFDFQIGSDDDALYFTNLNDDRDFVTVAIPAE